MQTYTVVADNERHVYTSDDLEQAVARAREAYTAGAAQYVVIFDDMTGDRTEIDPRGGPDAVADRLDTMARKSAPKQGPGRPKLGVVSREVSLLPRQWEWLNAQRGGASAALRKLVDEARNDHQHRDAARQARDAAYKVMSVLAGDRPGFEEASRALFANRYADITPHIASWPAGLRDHLGRLVERARATQELASREAGT
ncbi:MAG: hypothetical protein JWM80_4334 [Cyanobacteria bacterium RYN_339]|nr:hypothetical protein [Cyanobacteria bacterium RYN_339]